MGKVINLKEFNKKTITKKMEYRRYLKWSKEHEEMVDTFDRLDNAVDKLVKSSRLKGIIEGCLGTSAIVGIASFIVIVVNNKKRL